MNDDKLDYMERAAHDALDALRKEYEMAAKPYIKILTDIAAIRPHVYVVDGQTMVPIFPERIAPSAPGSQK